MVGNGILETMKRIAILQSNYIPWKGYFDLISGVDEFVIYDTVQYTKNDWRNRNKVKTNKGVEWMSIPCYHRLHQRINETKVSERHWNEKHWKTLVHNYGTTKGFQLYKPLFEELYKGELSSYLSEINLMFIKAINGILGIHTKIRRSEEFNISADEKTEKLICICKQSGADVYLSGPRAKPYLNVALMNEEGIYVEWMYYSEYKEYNQLFPPFQHGVTVLDLIFNEGENAVKYLRQ